jgi:hypothetical protein
MQKVLPVASTLRDKNSGWAGPLVSRGAAATVGNVYEPYLELTAHLDILNDRLLHGFTFGEAYSCRREVSPGWEWPLEIHFIVLSQLDPDRLESFAEILRGMGRLS